MRKNAVARKNWTVFLLVAYLTLPRAFGEARPVRVGIFPAAPLVLQKDGKPGGLFIDLIEDFSRELDWKIEYVGGTWGELLAKLETGDIDLLPAVGYTSERLSKYDFSRNPVFIDSGVVFTKPSLVLHTVFDLEGKRVAAVRGSTFTQGFVDYLAPFGIHCELVLTDDNPAVMRAIASGAVDAGVSIYSLGTSLMREYPVTITPISFSPIALDFAVPKGKNGDLMEGINRLMAPMLVDPNSLYSRSYRAWINPPSTVFPVWLLWGMGGLLVLGLYLGFWNKMLQTQVLAKTKILEAEVAERKLAEESALRSLRERETLLRELYHRTKNTMQVVQSMVSLQADKFPNDENVVDLVRNTEGRIQAIALVHQMLYSSEDLSRISIRDYLTELSSQIMQSRGEHGDRISLTVSAEDRYILIDTAIPLGLIINELSSNSLKHAFPGGRKGRISIVVSTGTTGSIILRYSDDGVGVPEGFDFRSQASLGLKLVFGVAEQQLRGKVDIRSQGGIEYRIEIPILPYEARV